MILLQARVGNGRERELLYALVPVNLKPRLIMIIVILCEHLAVACPPLSAD